MPQSMGLSKRMKELDTCERRAGIRLEPDPYSVSSLSGGMTIGFIGWLLCWPRRRRS
jgi:hypothetical protein